jgi:uncharacterized protein YegL
MFISFVLDKSGSMLPLTKDTLGGFNGFVAEQQKDKTKCGFSLTLFDTKFATQTGDLQTLQPLTEATYSPSGNTALLDAIGNSISEMEKFGKGYDRHLMVILTDGEENSSKEYTQKHIQDLIKAKTELGWEFVYIGADADAWQGKNLGIQVTGHYKDDAAGTLSVYASASVNVTAMRTSRASGKSMGWGSDPDKSKSK